MDIFDRLSINKEKYSKVANKLLNQNYLVKKKADTRSDYVFVLQNRVFFIQQFETLGYELKIDETSGVIGIYNLYGTGRLRLKKLESIILLIIRLLYLEKKTEISLTDEVVVLVSEIREKYSMLQIANKENLDKKTLKDAIRIFKRYNLVHNLDRDIIEGDGRIIVYPSILMALPTDNIERLHKNCEEKLADYKGAREQDNENVTED